MLHMEHSGVKVLLFLPPVFWNSPVGVGDVCLLGEGLNFCGVSSSRWFSPDVSRALFGCRTRNHRRSTSWPWTSAGSRRCAFRSDASRGTTPARRTCNICTSDREVAPEQCFCCRRCRRYREIFACDGAAPGRSRTGSGRCRTWGEAAAAGKPPCKGLFTRTVSVSVPVSVPVKFLHYANGNGPSSCRMGTEPILPVKRPVSIGIM